MACKNTTRLKEAFKPVVCVWIRSYGLKFQILWEFSVARVQKSVFRAEFKCLKPNLSAVSFNF